MSLGPLGQVGKGALDVGSIVVRGPEILVGPVVEAAYVGLAEQRVAIVTDFRRAHGPIAAAPPSHATRTIAPIQDVQAHDPLMLSHYATGETGG